eukprot:1525031-Amphidinium_carterae.1
MKDFLSNLRSGHKSLQISIRTACSLSSFGCRRADVYTSGRFFAASLQVSLALWLLSQNNLQSLQQGGPLSKHRKRTKQDRKPVRMGV